MGQTLLLPIHTKLLIVFRLAYSLLNLAHSKGQGQGQGQSPFGVENSKPELRGHFAVC